MATIAKVAADCLGCCMRLSTCELCACVWYVMPGSCRRKRRRTPLHGWDGIKGWLKERRYPPSYKVGVVHWELLRRDPYVYDAMPRREITLTSTFTQAICKPSMLGNPEMLKGGPARCGMESL